MSSKSIESCVVVNTDKAALERLAAQASGGNRDALVSLCEAISRNVLFRVASRLHNRMDAEDVMQEILIRVCRNIQELKDAKAFGGWLNSIIVNETNRHMAKNAKHGVVLDIEEHLDDTIEIEEDLLCDDVISKEERNVVMQIINKLPERQWEAVMLHYYEGMSVTESAIVMKVTQPCISRYLTLAMAKIKKELEKQTGRASVLSSVALLPIGPLLIQVLQYEAAQTAVAPPEWITQAVNSGAAYAGATAEAATGAAAGIAAVKAMFGSLAVVATTVVAVPVIVISMWISGVFDSGNIWQAGIEAGITQGEITFSGGEVNCETVNPKHVAVWANNEGGGLIIYNWRITASGSEIILYSGESAAADEALVQMFSRGEDGIYTLCFLMEDTAGGTYEVSRQFRIQSHAE